MKPERLIVYTLVAGIVISFAFGAGFGVENIMSVLRNAQPAYLGYALFFQVIAVWATNMRWAKIVEYDGIKTDRWKLFNSTLSGIAFSNITPSSRLGGEPVRTFFLRKHSTADTAQSLATIITDRIFDQFSFFLVTIITLFFVLSSFFLPDWVSIALTVSLVLTLLIMFFITYLSITHDISSGIVSLFVKKFDMLKPLRKKLKDDVSAYSETVKAFLKKKRLWGWGIFYSSIMWVSDVLRVYFVFLALGAAVNPKLILIMLVLAPLAGLIPLLPGGLGLVEGAMILIYTSSGISLLLAGTATMVDRLISYWLLTFGGLFSSYYLGIKKYDENE
ncbi:MAG: flippase-like domain-containing protein [DPANN group archaeon]|nr:flippase-like domain-containing protein [DPANN group archaeon]